MRTSRRGVNRKATGTRIGFAKSFEETRPLFPQADESKCSARVLQGCKTGVATDSGVFNGDLLFIRGSCWLVVVVCLGPLGAGPISAFIPLLEAATRNLTLALEEGLWAEARPGLRAEWFPAEGSARPETESSHFSGGNKSARARKIAPAGDHQGRTTRK